MALVCAVRFSSRLCACRAALVSTKAAARLGSLQGQGCGMAFVQLRRGSLSTPVCTSFPSLYFLLRAGLLLGACKIRRRRFCVFVSNGLASSSARLDADVGERDIKHSASFDSRLVCAEHIADAPSPFFHAGRHGLPIVPRRDGHLRPQLQALSVRVPGALLPSSATLLLSTLLTATFKPFPTSLSRPLPPSPCRSVGSVTITSRRTSTIVVQRVEHRMTIQQSSSKPSNPTSTSPLTPSPSLAVLRLSRELTRPSVLARAGSNDCKRQRSYGINDARMKR